MKTPNGYLTTGEFAKLCHVNKQTLFHYDRIGILSPEITAENGYRYYSSLQLDTFNAISMLKELDMPLADIKEFLDKRTPENFLALLQEHSRLADEKIAELMWLKKFISGRINITKEGIAAKHDMIYMETRPEEFFIITEHSGGNDDRDVYAAISEHIGYCREHDIYSPYSIGGLIDSAAGPWEDEYYSYSHFYTKIEPEDAEGSENVTVLPPRTCICISSVKGFDAVSEMLNKIMLYAKEHNFEVGPYFFEDVLLDDMSCFGIDNYTLKISIPVI